MSVRRVGVFSIGAISVGANKALFAAQALAALIDTILKSPFGLFVTGSELSGQLAGLLGAQVSLSSALLNPTLYLAQLKNALTSSFATIPATISSLTRDLAPTISANAAVAAGIRAKLAGIKGLSDLAQLGRLAQLGTIADLRARLASGGVAYYVGTDSSFTAVAAALAAETPPPGFVAPAETYMVVLVAQEPSAIESLKFLFLTPP